MRPPPRLLTLAAWLSRSFLKLPPPVLARLVAPGVGEGLDLQARVAIATNARLGTRPPHRRTVAAARRELERASALLAPVAPPDVAVQALDLDTERGPLAARIYRYVDRQPPGRPRPALVYYHGGGFVLGSLDSADALCRELAHDTRAVVVSIAYRLAPEHPFPAGPDDALAGFRAVARDAERLGLDPARLAIGGDSAGGNLATVVALDTRRDARRPMFQLLIYPAVDLTRSFPSITRLGHGYFLERETLDWFARHYLPDPAAERHPRASPWYAPDVAGAPPAFVMTAGYDPLVDEGQAWAERLAAAGVRTELRNYPTLFHGFASTTGGISAARTAMLEAARALVDAWRA